MPLHVHLSYPDFENVGIKLYDVVCIRISQYCMVTSVLLHLQGCVNLSITTNRRLFSYCQTRVHWVATFAIFGGDQRHMVLGVPQCFSCIMKELCPRVRHLRVYAWILNSVPAISSQHRKLPSLSPYSSRLVPSMNSRLPRS